MNLAASQARSNDISRLSRRVLELVEKDLGRRLSPAVEPGEKEGRGFGHPDLGAYLVPFRYQAMWKDNPAE